MKHTPGPWWHVAIPGEWDGIETAERHATTLTAKLAYNNPANAARIVACVNACEGINPEVVPELSRALQQCLNALLDVQENVLGDPPDMWQRLNETIERAEQAIAKATQEER